MYGVLLYMKLVTSPIQNNAVTYHWLFELENFPIEEDLLETAENDVMEGDGTMVDDEVSDDRINWRLLGKRRRNGRRKLKISLVNYVDLIPIQSGSRKHRNGLVEEWSTNQISVDKATFKSNSDIPEIITSDLFHYDENKENIGVDGESFG